MKAKKEIAILFFIIAVLVFYIYSEKEDKTHYELPEIKPLQTEDITKIQINKAGSEISLVKDAGKWLVGEKKYPADNAIVETLIHKISGLTLTALASESKNYSIYELDEQNRIAVAAYKGDDLLRKIVIGKPASSYRHTFVIFGDDHRVFHADGNLKNDFDKKISDLRDKTVMAFNEDIIELDLKKGGEEMTIVKADAPVSVDVSDSGEGQSEPAAAAPKWTTSEGGAVNESEAEGIISTLSNFTCDNFIEDRTKEDFSSPIFTAVLKGTGTYTISIFAKQDNQYPTVSSESDYPCLISEWNANKVMKDFAVLIGEGQ